LDLSADLTVFAHPIANSPGGNMRSRPRIVLIHATPVAVDPIREAFASSWPDAELANILDDSLAPDRARSPDMTPALNDRILALARYGRSTGADGILFTCSAFGPAIERAAAVLDVPVLKPNEAMFEQSLQTGRKHAMIATFEPSCASMEAEFSKQADALAIPASLTTFVVEPAMSALRYGDEATHNRLVADKAAELTGYDSIILAHFSTARAAAEVRARTAIPVLTSPDAAVSKIRRILEPSFGQVG
jgi:Asp/Glu/hydantoin racemase